MISPLNPVWYTPSRSRVNSYKNCYCRQLNSRIHLTSPVTSRFSRSCKKLRLCLRDFDGPPSTSSFFCNFCSSVQTCTSLSRRTVRGRMPCSPPTPQRKPLKLTSLFCTAYHLLRISLRRQKLRVPPPSAPLVLSRAQVPTSPHPLNAFHAGYIRSGSDL